MEANLLGLPDRRILRGRAAVALLALWVATGSWQCSLFKPATPEPPSGDAIEPDYSDPDATLQSIRLAIEDKGRRNGSSVYSRAFADSLGSGDPRSYHATFDPVSVLRSGRPEPADWLPAQERTFYNRFVTLPTVTTADFEMLWEHDPSALDDQEDPVAKTWLLHRHYQVIASFQESGEEVIIANGYADLLLLQIGDRWAIVRWEDREDPQPMTNPEALSFGQRRLELLQ